MTQNVLVVGTVPFKFVTEPPFWNFMMGKPPQGVGYEEAHVISCDFMLAWDYYLKSVAPEHKLGSAGRMEYKRSLVDTARRSLVKIPPAHRIIMLHDEFLGRHGSRHYHDSMRRQAHIQDHEGLLRTACSLEALATHSPRAMLCLLQSDGTLDMAEQPLLSRIDGYNRTPRHYG